jgi:hypothetical protein
MHCEMLCLAHLLLTKAYTGILRSALVSGKEANARRELRHCPFFSFRLIIINSTHSLL